MVTEEEGEWRLESGAVAPAGPGNDAGGSSSLFSPQGTGHVRLGLREAGASERVARGPRPALPSRPLQVWAALAQHPCLATPASAFAQRFPSSVTPQGPAPTVLHSGLATQYLPSHSTGTYQVGTGSSQPWGPAPGSGPRTEWVPDTRVQSRCTNGHRSSGQMGLVTQGLSAVGPQQWFTEIQQKRF